MDSEERIPTNLRTLLILEFISSEGGPVSTSQIITALGLPKQTVHRLCATLLEEGFVIRDRHDKLWRPARRLRAMASGLLQASRFHITRHQILEELAQAVGETVNYVMPEDSGMSYIDRVETDWPFRVQLPVGSHVPFHCTASGKTFLASQPKRAREAFVRSLKLEQWTDNTITDADKLLAELQQVAKQGYALDREEFMEGMIAIAVPIRDPDGRYLASLAYHGPTIRMNLDTMVAEKQIIMDASAKLTEALFAGDD